MKKKNKVKVGGLMDNLRPSHNKIIRRMCWKEMSDINYRFNIIREMVATFFYMAEGKILGGGSEGLTYILDHILSEMDEFRRMINGETETEELERIRNERKKAA